jgi:putative transposase
MSRRPRIVAPGVPHHITQRGNNRQIVFFSDHDRQRYVEILREHVSRHHLHILAWCLMTNHVHLIAIPDRQESISLALGQTHAQYALEINRLRQRVGHLWHNRFFSCPLGTDHLFAAMRYVELNPVRADMVAAPWDWRWSSAAAHIGREVDDPLLDGTWQAWMQETRLGAWNYGDWRESLSVPLPGRTLEIFRRASQLGEPVGSEEFLNDLEHRAGRRLRVLPRGRPAKRKVAAAGKVV